MGNGRGRLSLRLLTSLAAVATAALCVGLGPAGSARAPTWQLVDYHQSACFSPRVTTSYFGIWISGKWKHSIDVGAQGLPAGATYWTSYAPIPPGSSTGVYSLAYVAVQLATGTPVGTYTAALWATDGKSRQTVPITINMTTRCGNY
jgi:hypothetical protein